MPYKIEALHNGEYRVINSQTGKVHSSHTTFEKANAQLRLLNGLMHGFVPTHNLLPRVIGQHSLHLLRRTRHESEITR